MKLFQIPLKIQFPIQRYSKIKYQNIIKNRQKILKNKNVAPSHSNKEVPDSESDPDYVENTSTLRNSEKQLNIMDQEEKGQTKREPHAETPGTKMPGAEDPETLVCDSPDSETLDPDSLDTDTLEEKGSSEDKENGETDTKNQKPKNEIDDKMLVTKSQQGDKAAFEKLVRLYSKYVYTNAFFILRDSHDAEDVSQEVFVKVFLSIKNFRGLSSFKTWLRKLTINTCIDKLRIKSKTLNKKISLETLEEGYEVVFTDLNHNIEKDFFSKETVKEVLSIIVNLEESYRVPLILRDLQDYSYREISILIKKPIGTVKTNIHRARKIIKDKMKYEKEKKR